MTFLTLALCLGPSGGAAAGQPAQNDTGETPFLTLALPESGEIQVENRRGGIGLELWDKDYVAVATTGGGGAQTAGRASASHRKTGGSKSVVQITKTERQLLIVVPRAPVASAPRLDLKIRFPARARLTVATTDGEVTVGSLPARLAVQTISGDINVIYGSARDLDITAQSLNGTLTLYKGGDQPEAVERVVRGKYQAQSEPGGRLVKLFSGRGRINLYPTRATEQPALGQVFDSVPLPPKIEANAAEANGPVSARRPAAGRRRRGRQVAALPEASPTPTPTPVAAQTPMEVDEDEVVRVEADLVTLNVSVVERANGRGLKGLTQDAFRLYEDNVEQQIEHFETANAPFDMLLLIDLSGSTAKVTDLIRAAALRFIQATRPQDRVGIIAFAGSTNVISPLTTDRTRLRSAIQAMQPPSGDTRLHDALDSAIKYLDGEADSTRRRAVIVLSDGLDSTLPNVTGTGSTLPYEELRSRVQEFDGVVYTIWTNTEYEAFSPQDIQPETFDLAHDRMEELAGAGGGVFYEVEKLEDLGNAYERVVEDLGTVYSLSYRPTNKQRDGRWRAIHVRLPRHPNAVARGKSGYRAN